MKTRATHNFRGNIYDLLKENGWGVGTKLKAEGGERVTITNVVGGDWVGEGRNPTYTFGSWTPANGGGRSTERGVQPYLPGMA